MPAKDIRITGNVQGVFFRAESKKIALKLGLCGWVRNVEDGSVEIHAEGSEEALLTFMEWCHEGPPAARVDIVEVLDALEEGEEGFLILS